MRYLDDARMHLRPGDILTLEIEVDPSYDPSTYEIRWTSVKQWAADPTDQPKVVVPIENRHVGQSFFVQCNITAKRDWHIMGIGADDFLFLVFRVLPPKA